jgi:hypothetical protein
MPESASPRARRADHGVMGETHVPEEPKKIHGDKLAEAFRDTRRAGDLPRHPASERKEKTGSGLSGDRRR